VLWAARGNHVDTVRLLIRRGANLQLENDKGSTPLYWAVRYGFIELVRVLLDEGRADVAQRRKLGLVTPLVSGFVACLGARHAAGPGRCPGTHADCPRPTGSQCRRVDDHHSRNDGSNGSSQRGQRRRRKGDTHFLQIYCNNLCT